MVAAIDPTPTTLRGACLGGAFSGGVPERWVLRPNPMGVDSGQLPFLGLLHAVKFSPEHMAYRGLYSTRSNCPHRASCAPVRRLPYPANLG